VERKEKKLSNGRQKIVNNFRDIMDILQRSIIIIGRVKMLLLPDQYHRLKT